MLRIVRRGKEERTEERSSTPEQSQAKIEPWKPRDGVTNCVVLPGGHVRRRLTLDDWIWQHRGSVPLWSSFRWVVGWKPDWSRFKREEGTGNCVDKIAFLRSITMKERKEVGQWFPTFWKLSLHSHFCYQLSGKSYFCRNLVITIKIFFPLLTAVISGCFLPLLWQCLS